MNTILHDENSKREHIAINMHIQRAFIHYSLARQHLCNGYAERETKSMAKMKNFEAMKALKQICSIPVYLLKNIMLKSNTYGISELKLYILEHFNENKHIISLMLTADRYSSTHSYHIHCSEIQRSVLVIDPNFSKMLKSEHLIFIVIIQLV